MSTGSPEQKRVAVQVLTPEGVVHDGVAAMVVAPSVGGELGILPRHVPLIAALQPGRTRLKMLDESEVVMATTEGYIAVEDDRVLIMVEQAELAGDIDRARAELALSAAQEAIQAAGDDEVALAAAQAALRRAENRLKVVDKAAS
ncbi:MAG: ATP synthase F1 subunit epsilon [Actinobacteria bacterium]|nr:ATP synthase F1 subunit epsilon [Actinomycetota bacterium]MBM3697806.1 ATP synthase F1 subunit epsilon [Actinomycetota bacterium]